MSFADSPPPLPAATYTELVSAIGRTGLASALAVGRLRRVARGVYVPADLSTPYALAAGLRGALAYRSAAAAWDLPLLSVEETVDVVVGRNDVRRQVPPGVILHRVGVSQAERRSGRTDALRTVLDCSRKLPFLDALAIGDAALHAGLVGDEELLRGVGRLRGPGSRAARAAVPLMTGLAESPLESGLRGQLHIAGVHGFVPQYEVRDGRSSFRLDLADPVAGVGLEADGFEWHGSRSALTRDCARLDRIQTLDWLILRFTYEQVFGDPDWVIDVIKRALALRHAEGGLRGATRRGLTH